MSIGYACITVGLHDKKMRSCIAKNATESNLREIIKHNLNILDYAIEYNAKNNIHLFRISSDLVPFGSSPLNTLKWWEDFHLEFLKIGEKLKKYKIRVSMHPGQYTVLNSNSDDVVRRAIDDLKYHAKILESLGTSSNSKIVLHIGGVYGDKASAKKRFVENFLLLPENIKGRIIIENDDKNYTISDLLEIGNDLKIPVVFDNLHNEINPSLEIREDKEWIELCVKTWTKNELPMKIHYSQQSKTGRKGSHSNTIEIDKFLEYYNHNELENKDIMLEVKDKDLSAIKCIISTTKTYKVKLLEEEWSKYKYIVLERSHKKYIEIRELLKEKENSVATEFYKLIQNALDNEGDKNSFVNAASHVWGYFKQKASNTEKEKYFSLVKSYEKGIISQEALKKYLYKLSVKYKEEYLLESHYFFML